MKVPADYFQKSDYIIQLDSEAWVGLYLSAVSLKDAVNAEKVKITGNKREIIEIFDMFDKFKPTKNYTVPPLED